MSEGSKESIKINSDNVVNEVHAVFHSNGGIAVGGFSSSLREALDQIGTIQEAVVRFFVDKAMAGELDTNYKIKEKRIISLDNLDKQIVK